MECVVFLFFSYDNRGSDGGDKDKNEIMQVMASELSFFVVFFFFVNGRNAKTI